MWGSAALAPHGKGARAGTQDVRYAAPQKIACGGAHSLYLTRPSNSQSSPGTKVYGWGGNRHNALGLGPEEEAAKESGQRAQWKQALGEPSDAVFLNQAEKVAGLESVFAELRSANPGRDEVFLDLAEVACGANHSVLLESVLASVETAGQFTESRVWTMGIDANGQLGRGDAAEDGSESAAPGLVEMPTVGAARVIVQRIVCGTDHTLALANLAGGMESTAGRVFAWGLGSYGALGTGRWTDARTPQEVWFPGDFYEPESSGGTSERSVVIRQVAAGSKHSMALGSDGELYTWGHGGNGRLGLGRSDDGGAQSYSAQHTPKRLDLMVRFKYVAAGDAHCGAIDKLGSLYTWGQGSHGRCGHGNAADQATPRSVEMLAGISLAQVALGLMHSVAKTAEGKLYSWGQGPATGLDSGFEAVRTPRRLRLEDRTPVYQIAAGPKHTLVLMSDGHLLCFGSGGDGRMPFIDDQLGQAARNQTFPRYLANKFMGWAEPREDAALAQADNRGGSRRRGVDGASWWPCEVFCGGANTALITGDWGSHPNVDTHNLWIWGDRILAEAGEAPEKGEQLEPVLMKQGFRAPVKALAVGLQHCLALTTDGLMFSWGSGESGQLGTGSLKDAVAPQMMTYPADAIYIAAGEEHSACIIQGGQCYTWGTAEGGRLGLGNCLTDGIQLNPKKVDIDGVVDAHGMPATVRLRAVACGSQHTALISEDNRMLTFGLGWYGRLGQGTLDNSYVPTFVDVQGLSVREVHCAMYHTCIVDNDSVLWVCGRDACLARREGSGNILTPEPFEPFLQEPRRYVQSLATTDQHTLVLTHGGPLEGHEDDPGQELWVWGKNGRGQLGLPEAVAPRIEAPWQLRIPALEEKRPGRKARNRMLQVATGPGHSSLLALKRKPREPGQPAPTNGDERAMLPVVYSWGSSTSGRLGLTRDADRIVDQLHDAGHEAYQVSGPKQNPVYPPCPVEAAWQPNILEDEEELPQQQQQQQMSQAQEGEDAHQEQVKRSTPLQQWKWLDVQRKLWAEDMDKKQRSLEEKEKEAAASYQEVMEEICGLWDKNPSIAGANRTEYNLRAKDREIEAEFVRTLKALKLEHRAPRLEKWVRTDQVVLDSLHHFEELFFVLQQQPLYLANIGSRLIGLRAEDQQVEIFHKITGTLYQGVRHRRVRNLFKALLRVLIDYEVNKTEIRTVDELFDPTKSRVSYLLTQFCTNMWFLDKVAKPIIDPDDDESLVSVIIRFTVTKEPWTGEPVPRAKPENGAPFAGVCTSNQAEYEDLILPDKTWQEKAAMKWRRKAFQDEIAEFMKLCFGSDRKKGDAVAHASKGGGNSPMCNFLKKFIDKMMIRDKSAGMDDVRTLMVCVFTKVVQTPKFSLAFGKLSGEDLEDGICTPVAALVLSGIIGGVLQALESSQYALARLKIRQKVRQVAREAAAHKRHARLRDAEQQDEPNTESLEKRVLWNLQALAKFFQRIVHERLYETQYKAGDRSEQRETRECANYLKDFTNAALMSALREKANSTTSTGLIRDAGEDTTETQLTVDIYATHFSLSRQHIHFPTQELLEISNFLWTMVQGYNGAAGSMQVMLDSRHHDKLHQVLEKIMPKRRAKDGQPGHMRSVKWDKDGDVWLAQQHGECHNLVMHTRFLEFQRTGTEEPTFCEVSQVPMPRSFTRASQKRRSGVRVVKPFRLPEEELGPRIVPVPGGEYIYAFQEMEAFIQELADNKKFRNSVRYQIAGTSFLDLRSELDSIQKRIAQEIEDGRASSNMSALLSRLETGKLIVDKVGEISDPVEFFKYVESSMKRRASYHQYLEMVGEGKREIVAARNAYLKQVDDSYRLLSQLKTASLTCDLPEDIVSVAQQHSEPLVFTRTKRKKQKERKSNPTPAQRVIETLRQAGKVSEEELELAGAPAQHFTVSRLLNKGVITRLNASIPANVARKVNFHFQYQDEGYTVQVTMNNALLKEYHISRRDIQLLESGCKMAVLPQADEFLWANCFRLRRLLGMISAESGP